MEHFNRIEIGSEIVLKNGGITWFEDQAEELSRIYKDIRKEQPVEDMNS